MFMHGIWLKHRWPSWGYSVTQIGSGWKKRKEKKMKKKQKEITLRHFKLQVWCIHGWVIALVRSHFRPRNVEARGVWDNVLVSFTGVCRSSHAGTGSSMFFLSLYWCYISFHTHKKNSNLLFDWKVSKFVHMEVQKIMQF